MLVGKHQIQQPYPVPIKLHQSQVDRPGMRFPALFSELAVIGGTAPQIGTFIRPRTEDGGGFARIIHKNDATSRSPRGYAL